MAPSNWTKKNILKDGYPMHAKRASDVVDKMLHNNILYLMFKSEDSPSGDLGITEIARLTLDSFQANGKK